MERKEKLTSFGVIIHRCFLQEEFKIDGINDDNNFDSTNDEAQTNHEGIQYFFRLISDEKVKVILSIDLIDDFFHVHAKSNTKIGMKIKYPASSYTAYYTPHQSLLAKRDSNTEAIIIHIKEHLIFPLLFLD